MSPRGTSNSNARGSAVDRRRRREWLVETYRADIDASTNQGGDVQPYNPRLNACGYRRSLAAAGGWNAGAANVHTNALRLFLPGKADDDHRPQR